MMKNLLPVVMVVSACSGAPLGITTGGVFLVSVGTEQFRVRIDNALLASQARNSLSSGRFQIIKGTLARGDGGFNTGYSWHLAPNTIQFIDARENTCDGTPSQVEAAVDHWVDVVKSFCPSAGHVVREEGRI